MRRGYRDDADERSPEDAGRIRATLDAPGRRIAAGTFDHNDESTTVRGFADGRWKDPEIICPARTIRLTAEERARFKAVGIDLAESRGGGQPRFTFARDEA